MILETRREICARNEGLTVVFVNVKAARCCAFTNSRQTRKERRKMVSRCITSAGHEVRSRTR